MYAVPELAKIRPGLMCHTKGKRIFFSIYYKTADHAFRRAAKTWKDNVIYKEGFRAGQDKFLEYEVTYETEFKKAWRNVSLEANFGGYSVWAGNIFSHASKQDDGRDGLEFRVSGTTNQHRTLLQSEIQALSQLPWEDKAYLILSGCNTGKEGERTWSPARTFSTFQKVAVVGQDGWSYFSKKWPRYVEQAPNDGHIYLWSYDRARNSSTFGLLGDAERKPGIVFNKLGVRQ